MIHGAIEINFRIMGMNYGRAVVIGSGIGGLLAARALADFFPAITLLERDCLPAGSDHRKGVPQGRHAHGLLPTGLNVLEGFFPGLRHDLIQRGAVYCNSSAQILRFYGGGYHCQFPGERTGVLASRPCLEACLRDRVRRLANVQILENVNACGLIMDAGRSRVIAVQVTDRTNHREDQLACDLLVDAGGRASRSPHWLRSYGFTSPPEEEVEVGLTYVTRHFQRCDSHLAGNLGASIPATPANPRTGAILAEEGNRWIVTLGFYFDEKPPADAAGFAEAARRLPAPDIYQVVRDAEPLDEPATFHFPSSLRRRYERLKAFPGGYLVFGDAICSFNPVYGQGMTVAALQAKALRLALLGDRDRLARRFFRAAAQIIANPWQIVTANDLQLRQAQAPRRWPMGFLEWYRHRVHIAARRDPVVANAFQEVSELARAPSRLLQPAMVGRVVAGNLRQGVAQAPLQVPLRH
jgi:2-polyprenyl-6-methoxyphenol hydroxylase-like FAD-dependent oxidoreductase